MMVSFMHDDDNLLRQKITLFLSHCHCIVKKHSLIIFYCVMRFPQMNSVKTNKCNYKSTVSYYVCRHYYNMLS